MSIKALVLAQGDASGLVVIIAQLDAPARRLLAVEVGFKEFEKILADFEAKLSKFFGSVHAYSCFYARLAHIGGMIVEARLASFVGIRT
jgi:hypothetical protein